VAGQWKVDRKVWYIELERPLALFFPTRMRSSFAVIRRVEAARRWVGRVGRNGACAISARESIPE